MYLSAALKSLPLPGVFCAGRSLILYTKVTQIAKGFSVSMGPNGLTHVLTYMGRCSKIVGKEQDACRYGLRTASGKDERMKKYAVIVVDMLNDFVTGALGCDRGREIVPALQGLLREARAHGVPVIYANDSHLKGIDRELKLWGDHAIRGTRGAQVIPQLEPQETDYIVPKRRYSGFYQTDMQMLLSELGVDTVIVTGLHTHMCCRHTCADAYYLGYDIIVPRETTNAFTEEDYTGGLNYLKEVYGAEICSVGEVTKRF